MKRFVVSCWLLVACAMTAGAARAGDPVAEGKAWLRQNRVGGLNLSLVSVFGR